LEAAGRLVLTDEGKVNVARAQGWTAAIDIVYELPL
jgi:hypothetical protein